MMADYLDDKGLLFLLQLASPSLPVGAYSYSEGLESLVDRAIITTRQNLEDWLLQELHYGAIRLEAAVMLRSYNSVIQCDLAALNYWNAWLSAARETHELRQQSWQMGQSLLKLLSQLQPEITGLTDSVTAPCNYAVAFGIASAYWHIDPQASVLSYLHSWAMNLISAGVRLIPLGQTEGQQLLLSLHPSLRQISQEILVLEDDRLSSCGWGLALASMSHETQYTRLFRS